jgi:hypothetical protein
MLMKKAWLLGLGLITAATIFSGLPSKARASAPASTTKKEISFTEHTLVTRAGNKADFTLFHYVNDLGEREVAVQHDEKRVLLPDTAKMVLFGRDLNADGFYDAWFYVDGTGLVEGIDRASREGSGWDAASEILLKLHPKRRFLLGVAFNSLAANLTISRGHAKSVLQKMTREEMDLRDLEIRLARMKLQKAQEDEVQFYEDLISDGWEQVAEELSHEGTKKQFLLGAADVAIFVGGGVAFKGIGLASKWAAPRILESGAARFAEEAYAKHLGSAVSKIRAVKNRVTTRVTNTAASQPLQWASRKASERTIVALRSLESRNRVGSFAVKGLSRGAKLAHAGLKNWKYMAMTQSAQLVTEIIGRKDTVFSRNPIILGKNIVNDRDLIQNMAYMGSETFLLTSISSGMTSLPKRMAICGLVSLVNSNVMNFLIKGQTDLKRNAIDTGWEVVIGNGQTQVDLAALTYFETKAAAVGNPKLRLVGYAIALTDQTLGYFGYGWATRKYEASKKASEDEKALVASAEKHVELVPIFAPKPSS